MNKAESKYFQTAQRMDDALIALLKEKDLAYITVKALCQKAGVNRSTFYLHYETMADLADEALARIVQRFHDCFQAEEETVARIPTCELEELIFIQRAYLLPYLRFVRENQNVYRAAFRNPNALNAMKRYGDVRAQVIEPVLQRFGVPRAHWRYMIAYYIEGTMAIIRTWMDDGCRETDEAMADLILSCVRPFDPTKMQQSAQSAP